MAEPYAIIFMAEPYAIYHGITMANDLDYAEFACYSDSSVCINLINGFIERYHIYTVLIQCIKQLSHQTNVMATHTLRERNQCANFMAKFIASSNVDLLLHKLSCAGLINLLRSDANDTLVPFGPAFIQLLYIFKEKLGQTQHQ